MRQLNHRYGVFKRGLCIAIGVLLCAGAGTPANLNIPEAEADEFHFVVLGDSQFHDPAKFNRLIDQTRQLRPAFVIQVGDLIEGYQDDLDVIKQEWQRFSDQIAPLGPIPFLPLPGNHDVFNAGKRVDTRLEQLYEQTWGPLYYSFEYKNALFVALNSDSSEAENDIVGEQMKWLKRTLRNSEAAHKFVFMHKPPQLTQSGDDLHELFKSNGVSHVFYGHHHHYHFFERDGIAYTMTNAAANSAHDHDAVGSFHHLLQVSVRADEVDVAVIKADAILQQNVVYPDDNYDMFALTRRLAPAEVQLTETGPNTYDFVFELNNLSRRDIQAMVSCTSADQRWLLAPKVIQPIELAGKSRHELRLQASYTEQRVPESVPTCTVQVPFQSHHGEWIEYRTQVRGLR